MENPMNKWMILGGLHPYFLETSRYDYRCMIQNDFVPLWGHIKVLVGVATAGKFVQQTIYLLTH